MSDETKHQHKKCSPNHVARTTILNKLKEQVKDADYTKLPDEKSYQYPTMTHEQKVSQFVSLLEINHAQVIKLDEADIAKVVSDELKRRGIAKLLCGQESPYSSHIKAVDSNIAIAFYDFSLHGHKEYLFNEIPAGITSSFGAIAATGSIVLCPSENEPRTLSLVPPLHLVIVDGQKIEKDFASLIKTQQWDSHLPSNVLLISGPSKTADIQQTLAYGAHGPKTLIVLLINT